MAKRFLLFLTAAVLFAACSSSTKAVVANNQDNPGADVTDTTTIASKVTDIVAGVVAAGGVAQEVSFDKAATLSLASGSGVEVPAGAIPDMGVDDAAVMTVSANTLAAAPAFSSLAALPALPNGLNAYSEIIEVGLLRASNGETLDLLAAIKVKLKLLASYNVDLVELQIAILNDGKWTLVAATDIDKDGALANISSKDLGTFVLVGTGKLTPDTVAPVLGPITFSNTTITKTTLSWTVSDNRGTDGLEYRVFWRPAYQPALITDTLTVAQAEAESTISELTSGWTANLTTMTQDRLQYGLYKCIVFVRDAAGNQSSGIGSVTIPANTAPTPGGSGVISVGSITYDSATVSWVAATDKESPTDVKYLVYSSQANDIASANDADNNGTDETNGTPIAATSFVVKYMSPGQVYYVNVVAQDANYKRAAYTAVSFTTGTEGTVLFPSVTKSKGNLGGRTGADAMCADTSLAKVTCLKTPHAFISISASDSVSKMTDHGYFRSTKPLYGPGAVTKIADNATDLLDGTIATTLKSAGIKRDASSGLGYWSGNGSQDGSLGTSHCVNFTSSLSTDYSSIFKDDSTTAWMYDFSAYQCAWENQVLCACVVAIPAP